MKKLNVNLISPIKGFKLELNSSEEWVISVLNNVLPFKKFDTKSIQGKMNFLRTNLNIDIDGKISFVHHPCCARCGKEVETHENIYFTAHLAPLFEDVRSKKQHKEDEVELTREDLDFCFYEKDYIDLESLLNDEISLELKYNYYCQDSEKCELIQANNPNVTVNDTMDPRWAPLKKLKMN
jgi:uncharacterized metal-binding protein YceD (DUF177 family)